MSAPDLLAPHLHRKVRVVAREEGPHVKQLFDEAAGDKEQWDVEEWIVVTRFIDACELTIERWRQVRDLL